MIGSYNEKIRTAGKAVCPKQHLLPKNYQTLLPENRIHDNHFYIVTLNVPFLKRNVLQHSWKKLSNSNLYTLLGPQNEMHELLPMNTLFFKICWRITLVVELKIDFGRNFWWMHLCHVEWVQYKWCALWYCTNSHNKAETILHE